MECLLFSVPVQCLFSQHGLPFTPFFLFLTSPNSYLIATTLDLRKTEKNVKTFRSNPVQKTQLNKEKDERKAERAGKKSKAQHRSRSGLWHRKGMQFIWTLKKNLVLSKINFPLKKKNLQKSLSVSFICSSSVNLKYSLKRAMEKMNISFHIRN